tara:strand:- start:2909 stop:3160 length:252 start_codon:yes stop_codon:yes gene_type:complete
MLKADGLDRAVIGKTYDMAVQEYRLIYSVKKCIKILMERDGMDYSEARESLGFNALCVYMSKAQPIYVDAEEFDTIEDLCEDE